MKTTKINGVLTAMSPIHHGGDEKTGSEVMIRRMKYLVDDEIMQVPVVSGNAIRGPLRRRAFSDLSRRIDYEPTIKMYHMLFAGGILEEVGTGSGRIDLEMRESIRTMIPPLSLLGASILNQVISGKMQVGIATPVCSELNPYHPEHLQSDRSFYELLDDSFQTRKDDLKQREADEQAVQMMITFETLAPGTKFEHSFTLLDHDELEASCLRHMVDLWMQDPHIGGRSATGFGQVKIEYDWPKGFPKSDEYLSFVEENDNEILKTIKSLETALG